MNRFPPSFLLLEPGIDADGWQGIGQCTTYLSTHYPTATVIPTTSTARAAELAAEDETALAICSIKCAEVYDLEIIDRDIQDGGEGSSAFQSVEYPEAVLKQREEVGNTTRFIVLSLASTTLDLAYPVAPAIPSKSNGVLPYAPSL